MEFSDKISVKNESLIISIDKKEDDKSVYVLIKPQLDDATPVKLSHVFNFLPSGIINKRITGFGGTTLELDCKRPSVIIEPYNYTSYSKSKTPSLENKYPAFWYASNSSLKIYDPKRAAKKTSINRSLEIYLKTCDEFQTYPKIICIPDQITNLKEAIEKISGTYTWEDFHLLFDEIDSMQEQVSFRNSMHNLLSLYHDHPSSHRTFLSATLSEFNDPLLEDEPYYQFDYADREHVQVGIITTTGVGKRTALTILDTLKQHPDEKILIAYNYIDGINQVIGMLTEKEPSLQDKIAVICSEERKNEFINHFSRITPDLKTPEQITFITAAYFNGHDIMEKVHLISVIDAKVPTLRLSPRVLYQIQGRCRPGTLSQTWIAHFAPRRTPTIYKDELIEYAELSEQVFGFTKKLKKHKSEYLNKHAETIENIFINGTDNLPSVFALNLEGKRELSYFKLDSILEDSKILGYLRERKIFRHIAKQYFITEKLAEYEDEKDQRKEDSLEVAQKANHHIQDADLLFNSLDNKTLRVLRSTYNTTTGKRIIDIYKVVAGKKIFNISKVRAEIDKLLKEEHWQRRVNEFSKFIEYHGYISSKPQHPSHTFLPYMFKGLKDADKDTVQDLCQKFIFLLSTRKELLKKDAQKVINYFNTASRVKKILLDIKTEYKGKQAFYSLTSFNRSGILNLKEAPELNTRIKKYYRIEADREAYPEYYAQLDKLNNLTYEEKVILKAFGTSVEDLIKKIPKER
jgi:hypothetical protein